jgi:hypothetical protein
MCDLTTSPYCRPVSQKERGSEKFDQSKIAPGPVAEQNLGLTSPERHRRMV